MENQESKAETPPEQHSPRVLFDWMNNAASGGCWVGREILSKSKLLLTLFTKHATLKMKHDARVCVCCVPKYSKNFKIPLWHINSLLYWVFVHVMVEKLSGRCVQK